MTVPKLDIDQAVPCPECGEPLVVDLPIWITPGADIDLDMIDWREAEKFERWACPECTEFQGFPDDYKQGLSA